MASWALVWSVGQKRPRKWPKMDGRTADRRDVGQTDGLSNNWWSGSSIGLSVIVGQQFGCARGGGYMGASEKVSEPNIFPDWVLCQSRRTNTYVICRYVYLHTNRAIAVIFQFGESTYFFSDSGRLIRRT